VSIRHQAARHHTSLCKVAATFLPCSVFTTPPVTSISLYTAKQRVPMMPGWPLKFFQTVRLAAACMIALHDSSRRLHDSFTLIARCARMRGYGMHPRQR